MIKKIILFGLAIALSAIFLTGCCAVDPQLNLAEVEEIELLTLESFPVQIFVIAKGYPSDPCTDIHEISQTREGNNFFINIKT